MRGRRIFQSLGKAGWALLLMLSLTVGMRAESVKILGVGPARVKIGDLCLRGSLLPIRLDYTAAGGTRITWTSALFLTSSSLAAPLERLPSVVQVTEEGTRHELWLPEVRVPVVKQRTEMLLKILAQAEGSESTNASVRIFVYPLDMAKPLKEMVNRRHVPGRVW